MEVQLGNLIEKIKKEGVEEAQKKSDAILRKAEADAGTMIKQAREEAEKIIADARAQSDNFQKNSERAIQQALRDSVLLLKTRLTDLFDRIFKKEMAETLKPDFLKTLILEIVEQWGKGTDIEITVSEADRTELTKRLFQGLKKEMKDGIEIRVSSDISAGFRIGLKGSDAYYDFSDETLVEMLKQALNPKLREILDRSDG